MTNETLSKHLPFYFKPQVNHQIGGVNTVPDGTCRSSYNNAAMEFMFQAWIQSLSMMGI